MPLRLQRTSLHEPRDFTHALNVSKHSSTVASIQALAQYSHVRSYSSILKMANSGTAMSVAMVVVIVALSLQVNAQPDISAHSSHIKLRSFIPGLNSPARYGHLCALPLVWLMFVAIISCMGALCRHHTQGRHVL